MNHEEKKSLRVFFLQVADPQSKIKRVLNTVHHHFFSGDRCIIFVPNSKAAEYIDILLWKDPKESFVPHLIASESVKENIVITETKKNLNQAQIALNLCPEICPESQSFEKIYELWDISDPQKEKNSQQKLQAYAASTGISPIKI